MTKRYSIMFFSVKNANGDGFDCECWSTNTRNGFCHTCHIVGLTDTKLSYFNRTWESFEYETVLINAIEKYNRVFKTNLNIKDVVR